MTPLLSVSLAIGVAFLGSIGLTAAQSALLGQIDGRVVFAGQVTRPVPGATIVLSAGTRVLATTTTDAQGRYSFLNVTPPCDCTIRASKAGFFGADLGAEVEASKPTRISLTPGQQVVDTELRLSAHASISGRVVNAKGQTRAKVPVRLLLKIQGSDRVFLVAGAATVTNDLGEYQLAGLRAGDYVVQLPSQRDQIGPAGDRTQVWPELFFPNVSTVSEATAITLVAGDSRRDVDFEVPVLNGYRLTGKVFGSGEDVKDLVVRLVGWGAETLSSAIALTTVDASGAFSFSGVPKGSYTIVASRTVAGLEDLSALMTAGNIPKPLGVGSAGFASLAARVVDPAVQLREWSLSRGRRVHGQASVAVEDRDVDRIAVPVALAASVAGTIEWEDGSRVEPLTLGAVRLEAADADPTLGLPKASTAALGVTASFKIEGVRPGEYLLRVGERNRIKSISINGRDAVSDVLSVASADLTNVRVVLTAKLGQISGSVSVSGVDERVAVIAFPSNRAEWGHSGWSADRVILTQASAKGLFTITDVPAGAYDVVAVRDSEVSWWRDVAFLQRLSLFATRVSVGPDGAPVIQVRVAPRSQ